MSAMGARNHTRPGGRGPSTEPIGDRSSDPPSEAPATSRLLRWILALGAAATALSAIIALGVKVADWWGDEPSLRLVDVQVWDPEVLRRETTISGSSLDIKIENGGDRAVLLSRVLVEVRQTLFLSRAPACRNCASVAFSCRYDVTLPGLGDLSRPRTYSVPISQEVPANGSDRFLITIGDPDLVERSRFLSYAVLFQIAFPYDDGDVIKSGWILATVGDRFRPPDDDTLGRLGGVNEAFHPTLSPEIASMLGLPSATVLAAPDAEPACV